MARLRDIKQSLPMQLLQAREAAMSKFRPMLRSHELTEQQWRVLRVLAAEKTMDAGELARRSLLLAPSLSRILANLESMGWVIRTIDAEDQRRSALSLTSRGIKKYSEVGPHSERLYREIEARFGRDRLELLYELLTELNVALADEEETMADVN